VPKDKKLSVTHKEHETFVIPGLLPVAHESVAKRTDGSKTSGWGWSRKEADEDLGKKVSQGKWKKPTR
jgi:hypothetical protein